MLFMKIFVRNKRFKIVMFKYIQMRPLKYEPFVWLFVVQFNNTVCTHFYHNIFL